MDMMQILIELDKQRENDPERRKILEAEYSNEYCEEAETFETETDLEFGE